MSLARQSALVWAGAICAAGFALATQIVLARHFGNETYGEIANAYVLAVLAATFGFQGISDVMLRLQGKVETANLARSAAGLLFFALFCITAWSLVAGTQIQNVAILIAFIPYAIVLGLLFAGMTYFQLRGDVRAISAWPAVQHAGRLLVSIGIVLLGMRAMYVPLAWSVVLLPVALFGLFKLLKSIQETDLDGSSSMNSGRILPAALPFSISRMLEFAEIQLPIVLAMSIIGAADAGLVAAALVFIQGLLLLPIAVFQRLLRARMHTVSQHDPKALLQLAIRGSGLMFLLGVIAAICMWPLVEFLLETMFGADYKAASGFLRILLLATPIWFASITMNSALVSSRLAIARLLLQLLAIGLMTCIAILFMNRGGIAPLGWAVLASQFLMLVGATILLIIRTNHANADDERMTAL